MADPDITRKLLTYRALYRLNRAFAHLDRSLDELLIAQVCKDDLPDEGHPCGWQDQLAETQAEINRRLTENLHKMEHGDMKRLGRIVDLAPQVRKLYFKEEQPDKPPRRKKARR